MKKREKQKIFHPRYSHFSWINFNINNGGKKEKRKQILITESSLVLIRNLTESYRFRAKRVKQSCSSQTDFITEKFSKDSQIKKYSIKRRNSRDSNLEQNLLTSHVLTAIKWESICGCISITKPLRQGKSTGEAWKVAFSVKMRIHQRNYIRCAPSSVLKSISFQFSHSIYKQLSTVIYWNILYIKENSYQFYASCMNSQVFHSGIILN